MLEQQQTAHISAAIAWLNQPPRCQRTTGGPRSGELSGVCAVRESLRLGSSTRYLGFKEQAHSRLNRGV